MKACPNCDSLNEDSAKYCNKCGASLEPGKTGGDKSSCGGCVVAIIVLVVLIALIASCTGSCGSSSNDSNTASKKTEKIPDVRGETAQNAMETIKDAGFTGTYKILDSKGRDKTESGPQGNVYKDTSVVASQKPKPGKSLDGVKTVTLKIKVRAKRETTEPKTHKPTRSERIRSLSKGQRYAQKAYDTGFAKGHQNLIKVYRTWDDNEMRYEDKYEGKRLVVAGKINNIRKTGNLAHQSPYPTITIEFTVKTGSSRGHGYAYFDFRSKSQKKALEKLSTGDNLVVSGKCANWGNYIDCYVAHNYL